MVVMCLGGARLSGGMSMRLRRTEISRGVGVTFAAVASSRHRNVCFALMFFSWERARRKVLGSRDRKESSQSHQSI